MNELPRLGPGAAPAEPTTPNIRVIGGMLRRHRWLLLACPLIGLAAGLAMASSREPVYEASALLLVGNRPAALVADASRGALVDPEMIGTEIEILRSRRLAREVVDSLGLEVMVSEPLDASRQEVVASHRVDERTESADYRFERQDDGTFAVTDAEEDRSAGSAIVGRPIRLPGAEVTLAPGALAHEEFILSVRSPASAATHLSRALSIEQPSSDVNVIRVGYEGADPGLVRDVPNVLTARYVALRDAVHRSEARNTAAFLREQLDTIAGQLALSEDRLQSFRENARVIDPAVEANSQVGQVAQLEAQRSALETERSALAREVAAVQRASAQRGDGPSPYRRLVGYPSLLRNEAATELLRSLGEIENQRAQLVSRRKPEDPEMRALNARIDEIENQLENIVVTYLQGLGNQVNSMDAELGQYRAQLNAIPAKEIEFARLSRQPRVLQGMYELLQTRLKEAEIAAAVEDASVRVVDPADWPTEPTGPGAPLFAIAFGTLGLMVGVALAFAREYADQAVHTRADVQAAIGIPVLGVIPDAAAMEGARRGGLLAGPRNRLLSAAGRRENGNGRPDGGAPMPTLYVSRNRAATPWTDAFNRLHTNIMFAQPEADPRTLLVTSPLPGDGKTNTAANLAVTLAQSGLRVLLIDADLRRGRVHTFFGDEPAPGLAELLAGETAPGALRSVDVGSGRPLRYIAAGAQSGNPVQLLGTAAMRNLVECAAAEYDRVILDSPPVNLFPDATVLSPYVDGVIVVARAGSTPFDALVDAADQLRYSNTRVVGAVLNGVDYSRDASYDTSYRWYQMTKDYAGAPAAAG